MSTSTATTGADIISNLSNLLPTGTYLAFQTLTPLFTNNGSCGRVEKIMTSLLIGVFEFICFILNFTDSVSTSSGKVYYGFVTSKGLFNPQFPSSGLQDVVGMFYNDGTGKYVLNVFDIINGILNLVIFSALALLTSPIITCFYASLSPTLIKTIPLLVGILVGMYFAFAPHARNGIGFALISGKTTLVSATASTATIAALKSAKKNGDREFLLGKNDNKDSSGDLLLQVNNARGNPFYEPNLSPAPTPAASPLYRSPNRGSNVMSQTSPTRGTTSSPTSSPINRV